MNFPPHDECLMTPDSMSALSSLAGRSIDCFLFGGEFRDQRLYAHNIVLASKPPASFRGNLPYPETPPPNVVWLRVEETASSADFNVHRIAASMGVPLHLTGGREFGELGGLTRVWTHLGRINFVRRVDILSTSKTVKSHDHYDPTLSYDFDFRIEIHAELPSLKLRLAFELEHPRHSSSAFVLSYDALPHDAAFPPATLDEQALSRHTHQLAEADIERLQAFILSRNPAPPP